MNDDLEKKGGRLTLARTVCSAAIGGTFQYGYNIAIINAPTVDICRFINDTSWERWATALESYQVTLIWSFIVSIFSLGGLLGALLAGPMAIRFGRKRSLLMNNVFLGLSCMLSMASRASRSFEMIVLGRLLIGINAGVSMNIQPMYFGESAPKHLRGAVALSSGIFTALGVVLGQVVGLSDISLMFGEEQGQHPGIFTALYTSALEHWNWSSAMELLGGQACWPFLLGSAAVPGLIQLLTLPWCPESPRYLLIDRGDKDACIRALQQLHGSDAADGEMAEILQEQAASTGERPRSLWELLRDQAVRWQLGSVMIVSSAMQLCGNDAIYFYASSVFQEAGISTDKIPYAAIGTGACEFAAVIMCSLLIEHLGRRLLLIGGYVLMAGWSVVFTVALSFQKTVDWMPYLCMTCIFAYILSFGMGPAGVTGILPTEIFNQAARPAAYMIAGSLMWINFFMVGMVFPLLVSELGDFCFVPFCVVCLLASGFIGFALPETKGKSLQEITCEFDKLNFPDRQRLQAFYQLGEILHSTAL